MSSKEFHLQVSTDGKTAVEMLAEASGFSRQKIKQAMQKGCVWLEKAKNPNGEQLTGHIQRLRRAKKALSMGETIHFYFDEKVLESETPAAILISDQGDYSIWNKPSGMLSQGSKWGDHCTIYRWAEKHLKPERTAYTVHRLDRAANGLIILAHKKQVAAKFAKLFQQRRVEKHYRVLVEGDFSNVLAGEEKHITISTDLEGKTAISHVSLIENDKKQNTSLLDVQIETGRKHQIRKHLSGLGFPVVGDRLYGSGKNEMDLQLAAVSLKFSCPVSGKIQYFEL